jgi:hypothetical protein
VRTARKRRGERERRGVPVVTSESDFRDLSIVSRDADRDGLFGDTGVVIDFEASLFISHTQQLFIW